MHSGIKSCICEQIVGAANENTFTVRHHDIVRMPGNLRKTKGKARWKGGLGVREACDSWHLAKKPPHCQTASNSSAAVLFNQIKYIVI